jgi:hypothetical protein
MTSKARTQNKFLSPPPETGPLISEAAKAKRQATVYDAVAGETSQSIPHTFTHIVQVESLQRDLSQIFLS